MPKQATKRGSAKVEKKKGKKGKGQRSPRIVATCATPHTRARHWSLYETLASQAASRRSRGRDRDDQSSPWSAEAVASVVVRDTPDAFLRVLQLHTDCFADPNAPKRGLSAYMFFANEQRENVREENPGISFGK